MKAVTTGSTAWLFRIVRLVNEKKLRPVLDRILPLHEARQAQELVEHRQQFGTLVLAPG